MSAEPIEVPAVALPPEASKPVRIPYTTTLPTTAVPNQFPMTMPSFVSSWPTFTPTTTSPSEFPTKAVPIVTPARTPIGAVSPLPTLVMSVTPDAAPTAFNQPIQTLTALSPEATTQMPTTHNF